MDMDPFVLDQDFSRRGYLLPVDVGDVQNGELDSENQ
jgi:hypothetical protein